MRDEDLVEEFLSGSEDAFDMLMSKYEKPVYLMVRAMTRDVEEARDITQRAFIKAFRGIKGLRERSRFKNWLYRIAVNLTRDHIRTRKDEADIDSLVVTDGRSSPEKELIDRDIIEKTKGFIGNLPPRQREVVILRIFRGMTFVEMSRILDVQPESLRANFHFGIKSLREYLRKGGIDHEM